MARLRRGFAYHELEQADYGKYLCGQAKSVGLNEIV